MTEEKVEGKEKLKMTWVVQMGKQKYASWDGRGTVWGGRDRGGFKGTFDVLRAQETISDKFLVLRNEVLTGQALGIISRKRQGE